MHGRRRGGRRQARREDVYDNLPAEVEAAFQLEERVTSDEEAREAWLGQLPFFAPTPEGVEAVRAAFADVVYRHQAVLHAGEGGELHALTALATSEIPILAIAGEHDNGTPPAAARRIAATAPRGDLVILDGVGHFPFAEAPDAYWSVVRAGSARQRPLGSEAGPPAAAGNNPVLGRIPTPRQARLAVGRANVNDGWVGVGFGRGAEFCALEAPPADWAQKLVACAGFRSLTRSERTRRWLERTSTAAG